MQFEMKLPQNRSRAVMFQDAADPNYLAKRMDAEPEKTDRLLDAVLNDDGAAIEAIEKLLDG